MLDYIACIFVRCLNVIFSFVPISASLWLGRRFGTIAFMVNRKRRLVAYANLKSAFAAEKSPRELRRITKKVYQNMVQTFMEVLNLTKVNKAYRDRYVEIINLESIRDAAKSGRGCILLTAHFGDWELLSLTSAIIGFPILVLVREQKMRRLNELLNALRESKGCKVVRKGMETRDILKALRGGGIVGILADQDAGKNGVFVDFFGRPTSTHSGAMEMASHTGCIILPNFIVRTGGPYHKVYLEKYIEVPKEAGEGEIRKAVQSYMSLLEAYVRKYPDQWLWLHKRWKSTPVRTVLVLSDGKAGHLNQSLAVAEALRKRRTGQGYKADDTKIVVVEVKYKNALAKAALSVCSRFASWRCHGCMMCMRACLEEEAYRKLMMTYADFVVSCGSSVAPANVFMSKENNAKNVIVMKPSPLIGAGKFDLAIVPEHDRPAVSKRTVVTTLAPNLAEADTLRSAGERVRRYAGIERSTVVGLLVGGDNPEFSLTPRIMEGVVSAVKRFCAEHDADIVATTSRRTSAEVERLLKERLGNDPTCKLLVIANEKNSEEVLPGILSLATLVVVSGESVSMVSEAISSGKKTVVFSLDNKAGSATKHERMLLGLEKNGYIRIASSEGLFRMMEDALSDKSPVRKIDDKEKILEAVGRLI
ncbi:MAG: mitochondrial fission ELM1 family protein [Candidatus Omnitrophica bacterium]|nr:mitochondrial fission ELM1 family protein [Candidatus Omnitrophota bacterium]